MTHVDIAFDVSDVVRMTTYQLVEAVVEAEIGDHATIWKARINEAGPDGVWDVIASATADTVWQALHDCARQLELASHEVAQGGTMEEPSGRPPGH